MCRRMTSFNLSFWHFHSVPNPTEWKIIDKITCPCLIADEKKNSWFAAVLALTELLAIATKPPTLHASPTHLCHSYSRSI